jgi:site-specific DNA recombinase
MPPRIILTRVSTDEQNKGNSPTDQLKVCRAYAEANGIDVPDAMIFHEDFSGYALERPELDKIRALLRAERGGTLIVRYGDRLARSVAVVDQLANEFARYDVDLHFVNRGRVDYTSPEGRFILHMEAAGNSYWGAKAKEAMANGKRAQIADGIPVAHGKPAYGYRWEGRKRETMLVIFEDEARIVRLIFCWYTVEGLSPTQIADRLNAEGAPIPARSLGIALGKRSDSGRWTLGNVRNVIRNETYTGTLYTYRHRYTDDTRVYVHDRAQWAALTVPAIIDRATWDRAQALIADGRRRFAIDTKKHNYLMARRLDCICGHTIVGATNGTKWDTTYYHCNSRKSVHGRCDLPYFRAQEVDRTVWKWIEALYHQPETIAEAFMRQNEEAHQQNADVDQRIADADETIDSLKRRLANLMRELVDADEYSKAALKNIQTELVNAIRETEQRRAAYEKQRVPTVPDERIRTVTQFGARLGKGLENAKTFADRLEVVEALDLTGTLLVKNGNLVVRLHWPTPTEGTELHVVREDASHCIDTHTT